MIFTVGHSTRTLEELVRILSSHKITAVVDVRHFPVSKKFPWFSRENLEKELEKHGIKYFWLGEELGGYRKEGYINYTKTDTYKKGIKKLLEIAKKERVAVLCAELVWWRCHRRFIADTLLEHGEEVLHIWDEKHVEKHEYKKYIERRVWCDKKVQKLAKKLHSFIGEKNEGDKKRSG